MPHPVDTSHCNIRRTRAMSPEQTLHSREPIERVRTVTEEQGEGTSQRTSIYESARSETLKEAEGGEN